MGEADASVEEVFADGFVLGAVEAVIFEEFFEGAACLIAVIHARDEGVEEGLDGVFELGLGAAGVGELVELGAVFWGEFFGFFAEKSGDAELVVSGGEEGVCSFEEVGVGAVGVDLEIVDDGVHGEGEGVLQFALGGDHDFLETDEGFFFALGVDDESHAAAGHAAEHPEAPEVVAEFGLGACDEGFGEVVGGPGDDGLEGAAEVVGGEFSELFDVSGFEGFEDLVEESEGFFAALPFGGGAEEVFFGDHLEDGADVLSHAAVDEDEGVLEGLA